jgi:hypothetical protein
MPSIDAPYFIPGAKARHPVIGLAALEWLPDDGCQTMVARRWLPDDGHLFTGERYVSWH